MLSNNNRYIYVMYMYILCFKCESLFISCVNNKYDDINDLLIELKKKTKNKKKTTITIKFIWNWEKKTKKATTVFNSCRLNLFIKFDDLSGGQNILNVSNEQRR